MANGSNNLLLRCENGRREIKHIVVCTLAIEMTTERARNT